MGKAAETDAYGWFCWGIDMDQVRVEEIMRSEPVCLQPEHQLTAALHQMYVEEHSLVPLVDEQGTHSASFRCGTL